MAMELLSSIVKGQLDSIRLVSCLECERHHHFRMLGYEEMRHAGRSQRDHLLFAIQLSS